MPTHQIVDAGPDSDIPIVISHVHRVNTDDCSYKLYFQGQVTDDPTPGKAYVCLQAEKADGSATSQSEVEITSFGTWAEYNLTKHLDTWLDTELILLRIILRWDSAAASTGHALKVRYVTIYGGMLTLPT
jgi:hypothetical protein